MTTKRKSARLSQSSSPGEHTRPPVRLLSQIESTRIKLDSCTKIGLKFYFHPYLQSNARLVIAIFVPLEEVRDGVVEEEDVANVDEARDHALPRQHHEHQRERERHGDVVVDEVGAEEEEEAGSLERGIF